MRQGAVPGSRFDVEPSGKYAWGRCSTRVISKETGVPARAGSGLLSYTRYSVYGHVLHGYQSVYNEAGLCSTDVWRKTDAEGSAAICKACLCRPCPRSAADMRPWGLDWLWAGLPRQTGVTESRQRSVFSYCHEGAQIWKNDRIQKTDPLKADRQQKVRPQSWKQRSPKGETQIDDAADLQIFVCVWAFSVRHLTQRRA